MGCVQGVQCSLVPTAHSQTLSFFIAVAMLAQQPTLRPRGSLLLLPVSWWLLLKDKLRLLALAEMRVVLVSEALLFGECLQLLLSPSLKALTHAFCHHNKPVFINKIKYSVFIH